MFYKYRKADPVVSWSVLVIKPAILWKKDCAFCKHNAADGRMICQPLAVLKTPQSLRDIYCEIDGFRSRDAQRLKEYDPTDVQAEVLVFDKIEPEYIAAVVFDSNEAKNNFAEQVGDRKTHVHPPNKGLFATRTYVREYC
jgi:hypothetical protein